MPAQKHTNRVKFIFLILALCLFGYLGRYLRVDIKGIQASLGGVPLIFSGILFVLFYVIVTFFVWLAKDLFWVVGALLFGPYVSASFVWLAECINASILFYLARLLGRGFVEHSLKDKYKNLDEKLGRLNFGWLFIFRVAPLIPYRFLDLGAGLTRMPFKKYFIAAILGSPFKIFWIQYIIAGVGEGVLGNPYAIMEYFMKNRVLFAFSLIYPVLIILVAFKIKSKG